MNKSQIVAEVARRTGLPPDDVASVVNAFIDVVTRSVARGEKVMLSGFGTFHRKTRARRTARDIAANRSIRVPATNVPAFRPGDPFLRLVARRRVRRTSRS